ncbi:hypothetical protein [Delftia lacustris]|uniref:hypothetical protein n=1 Tax=Delftia lacustris TaxID=558537 RepID=UPI00115F9C29|nr:hypothetical protein [Delftia lacustris]
MITKIVDVLEKINPAEIISCHFKTFLNARTKKMEWVAVALQVIVALCLAIVHVLYFKVSENVVGIVVSVASIIAGLLLNLMVLVYTLITGRLRISKSNASIVEKLGGEIIANIAFCILCSIVLVIGSLLNLTDVRWINITGQFIMCFFGAIVAFTIMMILVNFYTIIKNSAK